MGTGYISYSTTGWSLFTIAANGPIYELDANQLRVVRQLPNPGGTINGMAFLDDRIYIAREDAPDLVLDYNTGQVVRALSLQAWVIAATDTRLYGLTSGNRGLVELDPQTGAVVRQIGQLQRGSSDPGIIGDELFVFDNRVSYEAVVCVYDLNTAQLKRILPTIISDGRAIGAEGALDEDYYSIDLVADQPVTFSTGTPGNRSGDLANRLDPRLALFSPAGQLLASDDNSATDGRNAVLSHTPTASGKYFLRVSASNGSGAYTLSTAQTVQGSAVAGASPRFVESAPADPPEAPATPTAALESQAETPASGLAGADLLNSLLRVYSDSNEMSVDDPWTSTVYLEAGDAVAAIARPADLGGVLRIEILGLPGTAVSPAPGQPAILEAVAPASGHYTLRIDANTPGTVSLEVYRNARIEAVDTADAFELSLGISPLNNVSGYVAIVGASDPVVTVDEYKMDLTGRTGETLDLLLAGTADLSEARLDVIGVDELSVLASSTTLDRDQAILGFQVPADGIYTIRLTDRARGDYYILITERLRVEREPNDSAAASLRSLDGAWGSLGTLAAGSDDDDLYQVTLAAGEHWTFTTQTSFGFAGDPPQGGLDPQISLIAANGSVVASDDNSAENGRDARLTFTVAVAGVYTVRIHAQSGAGGYRLSALRDPWIRGGSGDDTFRIARDWTGRLIEVYCNTPPGGPPELQIPAGLSSSIRVEGGGGDDTLVIETALPFSPVFDGGGNNETLAVKTGRYELDDDNLKHPETVNLQAVGDSVLEIASALALRSLSVGDSAHVMILPGGDRLIQLGALNISDQGALDLADNDLILRHSDADHGAAKVQQLTQWVLSAINGPTGWDGPGLRSSAAKDDPDGGIATLAVQTNDDGEGNPIWTEFDEQAIDQNVVLVKFTWWGDCNLDGIISGDDYAQIDAAYLDRSMPKMWLFGDFNYDSVISGDDYSLIDGAYLSQRGRVLGSARPIANEAAQAVPSAPSSESGLIQKIELAMVRPIVPIHRAEDEESFLTDDLALLA